MVRHIRCYSEAALAHALSGPGWAITFAGCAIAHIEILDGVDSSAQRRYDAGSRAKRESVVKLLGLGG